MRGKAKRAGRPRPYKRERGSGIMRGGRSLPIQKQEEMRDGD